MLYEVITDISGVSANMTAAEVGPIIGKAMDGLVVEPQQIGIFDPSFPLERACLIRTAKDQRVTQGKVELKTVKYQSFNNSNDTRYIGENLDSPKSIDLIIV